MISRASTTGLEQESLASLLARYLGPPATGEDYGRWADLAADYFRASADTDGA